jgi:hypothetical protein
MFRPLETFTGFVSDATRPNRVFPVDRLPVENERLLNSDKTSCRKRVLIRVFQKVIPGNKNRVKGKDPDMGKIRLYVFDIEKI